MSPGANVHQSAPPDDIVQGPLGAIPAEPEPPSVERIRRLLRLADGISTQVSISRAEALDRIATVFAEAALVDEFLGEPTRAELRISAGVACRLAQRERAGSIWSGGPL